MRVVDICSFNPLDYKSGGVGSTTFHINSALVRHGIEVINICFANESFVKESKMGKVIAIKTYDNELLKLLTYPIRSALLARKLKPDVLIGEGPSNFGGSLIASLIRKPNTIHIERAHGTHMNLILSTQKKSLHMRILGRLMAEIIERYQFILADYSFCVSYSVRNELIKYYKINKSRIKVIVSGTDTKKYKPLGKAKKAELRSSMRFYDGMVYILYIGTDPSRKGLDIVLRSMELLRDMPIHLNVIGIDNDNGLNFIRNNYIKHLDADRISFIGKINEDEKIKYYKASDLLFFPSRYEGIALVSLDALSSGLPMVVSNMVGIEQIAGSSSGVFVSPDFDPKHYADIIVKLIDRIDRLDKCKKNARKIALQYDWIRVGERYYDAIMHIVKSELHER